MNPAILLQLLQGGASVLGGLTKAAGDIVPTEYETENRKRMSSLKALMQSGGLGLTDEEKARLYEQGSASLEKQIQSSSDAANQLLASNGTGGQALKAATALEAEAGKSRGAINKNVDAMDAQRKQQMEQEYWARLQSDSVAKQNRLNAIGSVLGLGADVASGAAGVNATVQPTTSASRLDSKLISDLQEQYGLSPEDARALASAHSDNPSLIATLKKLLQ